LKQHLQRGKRQAPNGAGGKDWTIDENVTQMRKLSRTRRKIWHQPKYAGKNTR